MSDAASETEVGRRRSIMLRKGVFDLAHEFRGELLDASFEEGSDLTAELCDKVHAEGLQLQKITLSRQQQSRDHRVDVH